MSNKTFGLPSPQLAFTNPKTGIVSSAWYQFLTRLQQLSAERQIAPVTVGSSPFVYTASTIGNLFVSGGAVSSVVLSRSGVNLTVPSGIFIPLAADDAVSVTYTVLPTMTFVPSARA